MIKSLQQAKRFLTILFGFTLLALGILMLALPGPGLLTILFGLGILAAEYLWARRLLDRVKHHSDRLRSSIFQRDTIPAPPPPTTASPSAAPPPVTTVNLETTLHCQPLSAPTKRA